MATFPGRYQSLNDSGATWATLNPVLQVGELAIADPGSSTPIIKCGDGVRPWSALPALNAPVDAANDYVVGVTTTLPPGSSATVVIDNTVDPPTINFGLPSGPAGPPNSLTMGTVVTGAPGSPAAASITGAAPNQVLNLTIPTGAPGPTGSTGATGPAGADGTDGIDGAQGPPNTLTIGTVVTGTPGSPASATITGAAPNQTLNLTLPQGATGPQGPQGIPGPSGAPNLGDPTALVGLTAINGTGINAMRADGAPALSQAIAPTWSGQHAFMAPTFFASAVEHFGTTGPTVRHSVTRGSADSIGPGLTLAKTRSSVYDGLTPVQLDDVLGTINYHGADGTSLNTLASFIYSIVAGTVSTGSIPSELRLGTTPVGGGPTERLRISSVGALGIAGPNYGTAGQALISGGAAAPPAWGNVGLTGASFANPTASVGLTAVNGSALTAMRSDGAPALNVAIAPTWSGAHTFNSAVDLAGILKASGVEGVSGQVLSSQGAGLPAIWRTSSGGSIELGYNFSTAVGTANPGAQKMSLNSAVYSSVTVAVFNSTAFTNFDANTILSLLNVGNRIYIQQRNDASKAVVYEVTAPGTNNTGYWTIPVKHIDSRGTMFPANADLNAVFILSVSSSSLANPTATIGLAAINGSATTGMRSDAAPALSQAIAPTWSGVHTFTPSGTATPVNVNGPSGDWTAKFTNSAATPYGVLITAGINGVASLYVRRGDSGNRNLLIVQADLFQFGNTTDNPGFNFLGAGQMNVGGEIQATGRVLSINAAGTGPSLGAHVSGVEGIYLVANNSGTTVAGMPNGGYGLATLAGSNISFCLNGIIRAQSTPTGFYTSGNFRCDDGLQNTGGNLKLVPNLGGGSGLTYGTYYVEGAVGTYHGIAVKDGTLNPTLMSSGVASGLYLQGEAKWLLFRSDASNAITQYALNAVGFYTAAASGGNMGAGTINATAYYVNGVALASGPSAANPSASVGLTAANGSAGTFMRSDAAPALSVAISPTWSGTHTFSNAVTAPSFVTSSARAIKRETGAPRYAADILARLRPLLYRLIDSDDREQLGLIAEEVHEVCPQLSDGKTVAYDRLAILLLAAWQDDHARAA